jgi:hypothetical protein
MDGVVESGADGAFDIDDVRWLEDKTKTKTKIKTKT